MEIIVCAVGVAIISGLLFWYARLLAGRERRLLAGALGIPDFTPTQTLFSPNGRVGLAVDDERKKVCLLTRRRDAVSARVLDYRDLLSCEIFEDHSTVTKTVRSSQITGAVVGGTLLGGVGVIVGGLSGARKARTKVRRIDLRLTVNDSRSPLHDVPLLRAPCKKDGFVYRSAMDKARHWHGAMKVLLEQDDAPRHAASQRVTPRFRQQSD